MDTGTSCSALKDKEIQVRLSILVCYSVLLSEVDPVRPCITNPRMIPGQALVTRLQGDVRERHTQLTALQSDVQTIRDHIRERWVRTHSI